MKLQKSQHGLVVQLFAACRKEGMTLNQTNDFINAQLGLDLEKTRYYQIYLKALKDGSAPDDARLPKVLSDIDSSDFEDFEDTAEVSYITGAPLDKTVDALDQLIVEGVVRRGNNLIRARINEYSRNVAARSAVRSILLDILGDFSEQVKKTLTETNTVFDRLQVRNGTMPPIYAFGDTHWGYTINQAAPHIVYNVDVAKQRLTQMFEWVVEDTLTNKYNEIYLLNLADDIEGAALRVVQLFTSVESMSKSARDFAFFILKKLRWLHDVLPGVQINYLHVSEDNHAQLRLHGTQRDELPDTMLLLIVSIIEAAIDTAHSFGMLERLTMASKPEFLLQFGNMNIVAMHGHKYEKTAKILEDVSTLYETKVHGAIVGHWHSFSVKNKNRFGGIQETMVFIPAIVGETDYSVNRLKFKNKPGFAKVTVDTSGNFMNAIQILFNNGESNVKK